MVMTGTVAGPTYMARAGESNKGSTEGASEKEPEGGGDNGGDNTGGGGDDNGGDNTGGGGDDNGGDNTGGGGDDNGGDNTGGDDGGSGNTGDNGGNGSTGDDGGDGSGAGNTGDGSGEGSTDDQSELGGTDSTAVTGSTIDPTIAATEEPASEEDLGEPEGYAEADNYDGTNEELIAQQHIVFDMPVIRKDFRFTTVDKVFAFSAEELEILEAREDGAEVVGRIARNGVLYELEEEDNGWIYVESGKVRGFVREDDLIRGEDAEKMLDLLEKQAERISRMLPEGISKDAYFFTAQETVPYYENAAYAFRRITTEDTVAFRRITTEDTVITKKPAIAKAETGIMEECGEDAREAGRLSEGGLCYVIEDAGEGWLFVESGDVRGFVKVSALDQSGAAKAKVEEAGEDALKTAVEEIKPADNKATYYTVTSIKEGAKYNEVREKILEKALSCVGNPYVWGGTSLTHGADCSGFVQSLYSLFGYHLPRVAAAQSRVGTQIPVSDAAPGDLIFFARNGYVYHVAMYAGDGKTVEAYSSQYGIITKELSERNAVWATRIIED